MTLPTSGYSENHISSVDNGVSGISTESAFPVEGCDAISNLALPAVISIGSYNINGRCHAIDFADRVAVPVERERSKCSIDAPINITVAF